MTEALVETWPQAFAIAAEVLGGAIVCVATLVFVYKLCRD